MGDTIPAGTTPMLFKNPDGSLTSGDVPIDRAQEAVGKGFIPAVAMTSPEGKLGYVPHENVKGAIEKGFKIGQPSAQGSTDGATAGSVGREASLGFASGAGLPETQHASDFSVLPGLKQIITHPINSAELVGDQINAGRDAQFAKAKKDYQSGGWQGKTAAGLDFLGGAIPLLGPAAMGAGSELEHGIHSGDPNEAAHGAGQAAGLLATLALGTKTGQKLSGNAIDAGAGAVRDVGAGIKAGGGKVVAPFKARLAPESDVAITRAINPKDAKTFQANVQASLPEIASAAQQSGGKIGSVSDLSSGITAAKKNVWTKVQEALGPNNAVTVDGNAIADRISGSIDKRTAAQNPELAKRIGVIADTYRKPISIADTEANLESVNNELNSYYAKNKINRQQAMGDPDIKYKLAEADALRDILDQQVNNLPDGGKFSQLKQSYGSLRSLQEDVFRRQLQLAKQELANPTDALKTAGKVGKVLRSAANLRVGDSFVNAYDALNKTPDQLVEHAFNKYSGPTATPPTNLPPFLRQQAPLPRGNSPSNKLDFLQQVQQAPQSSVTGLGAKGEAGTLVRLKGLLPAPTETVPTPPPSPTNLIDILRDRNAAQQLPGGGVIKQPVPAQKFLPAPKPDVPRAVPAKPSPASLIDIIRQPSGSIPLGDTGKAGVIVRNKGLLPGATLPSSRSALESSPHFRTFFGNSKVVTESGSPKVVYHGTPNPGFDEFSPEMRGAHSKSPDSTETFSFTDNPETADTYAHGHEGRMSNKYRQVFGGAPKIEPSKSATYPVYLKIEKPLVVTNPRQFNTPDFVAKAKAEGYDGIIRNLPNGETEYSVFSPKQIKSAVGNSGAFDTESNSLTDSSLPNFLRKSK